MSNSRIARIRGGLRLGVAGLFAVSGSVHLLKPKVFYPLIPRVLPARDAVIYGSGVAELACSIGLLTNRSWAPNTSAALLVGVWPGNVEYAVRASRRKGLASTQSVIAWARVPLQLPLIWAVLAPPKSVSSVG